MYLQYYEGTLKNHIVSISCLLKHSVPSAFYHHLKKVYLENTQNIMET